MRTIIIIFLAFQLVEINAQSVLKTMKKLPDTGQTSDYTSTFGEDSDYAINTPYYIDNGDGTVTDTITGLMWQKTDGGEMKFDSAIIYVNSLNLAGYNDWRLPNVSESFSIMKLDAVNPSINTTYFTNTGAEYWWTIDSCFNNPSKIWVTNSGGGQGPHPINETVSAGGTKKFHTRAVRNVRQPISILNRFIDNGDSTITDKVTGLMWQKFSYGDTLYWDAALQYAENLVLANHSDWRLPNIKEMESINNIKANSPSVYSSVFPNLKPKKHWSSTSQFNHGNNAWFIDFQNYGITSYLSKTTRALYFLCVRNNTPVLTDINHSNLNGSGIIVYPNPISNFINFKISDLRSGVYSLKIYSSLGKLVYDNNILLNSENDILKIETNFESGLYYYSFSSDSIEISQGKFIVN